MPDDLSAAAAPGAVGGEPIGLLGQGLDLMRLGRLAEAEPLLAAAAAAMPGRAEPRLYLGQVAAIRGDGGAARAHLLAALRRAPEDPLVLAALAGLAETEGRLDEAAAFLAAVGEEDARDPEFDVWAARLALRRRQPAEALAAAERALAAGAAIAEPARHAARALLQLEGRDGAMRHVRARAAADPFAPAWSVLAAVLHAMQGELADAVAELRTAAALAPEDACVQGELGLALAAADDFAAAETALRAALTARPNDVALRNRLGLVVWKSHRIGEARAILDAAVADLGPDPAVLMNQALVTNLCGEQEAALAAVGRIVRRSGGDRDALITRLNLLPYHPSGDAAALLAAAQAVGRAFGPPPAAPERPRDPERRLRIGLLSGTLCRHPVGWLTIAGIEALPDAAFDLFGYSLRQREDPIAARFRTRCATWREMGAADPASVARIIEGDGIDILIDLGGYGDGGCPAAVALKPAPVQIKWVGAQFSTTGLAAMDWMLTDRWETPPGFERFYTERLLRLPDGYVCYDPPAYAPAVGPLPAARNGHVTFGCFNNLAKVTDPVLQAWSRIMAALPDARLQLRTHALGDAAVRAALAARLRGADIDPGRVDMHGGLPHQALLEAYGGIDIALDPFPYAGGLTVCEALWMGVPVVSLHGDGFAARHGLSHLSNVGLGGWSVGTVEAYVALAVDRARAPGDLAALRHGLRERVRASPLCDAPRFGRSLGAALRLAWREHCLG